jgi:hypothetical protein
MWGRRRGRKSEVFLEVKYVRRKANPRAIPALMLFFVARDGGRTRESVWEGQKKPRLAKKCAAGAEISQ